MDGIGQCAEQTNLISLDRGGNGRPRPTRVLAAKCLNCPFRCRQGLALKMAVHTRRVGHGKSRKTTES